MFDTMTKVPCQIHSVLHEVIILITGNFTSEFDNQILSFSTFKKTVFNINNVLFYYHCSFSVIRPIDSTV